MKIQTGSVLLGLAVGMFAIAAVIFLYIFWEDLPYLSQTARKAVVEAVPETLPDEAFACSEARDCIYTKPHVCQGKCVIASGLDCGFGAKAINRTWCLDQQAPGTCLAVVGQNKYADQCKEVDCVDNRCVTK